jgi:hypothetical protein
MKPRFTFDPREVDDFVRKLDLRSELIYRLALRGLCQACRSDGAFVQRTDDLMARFGEGELGDILAEADRVSRELTASK